MDAYHNHDWPECYDLWVRFLFGDEPSYDTSLFTEHLGHLWNRSRSDTFTVVDVGCGTGRTIRDLCTFAKADKQINNGSLNRRLRLIGADPAVAMLERAKLLQERFAARKSLPAHVEVSFTPIGAAEIGTLARNVEPGHVDLLTFAAGGICHLVGDGEMAKFLLAAGEMLHEDGVAIVSVLHEFMSGSSWEGIEQKVQDLPGANENQGGNKIFRVSSEEHEGLVYVKYPASANWSDNKSIRTDTFRLAVEDESGATIREHELQWKVVMLDGAVWEKGLRDAGLKIVDRKIVAEAGQTWFVLQKQTLA
jgi:SAM-dependent methyltransferase